MVLDIAHAVDVLSKAESRVVFVPEVESGYGGPSSSGFEAEVAVRCAHIGKSCPSKILGQLQLLPHRHRVVRTMRPDTRHDFEVVVPWPALNETERNTGFDHRHDSLAWPVGADSMP